MAFNKKRRAYDQDVDHVLVLLGQAVPEGVEQGGDDQQLIFHQRNFSVTTLTENKRI